MFWTTIRQLFLTYSEQIRDSKHWWQFLAKWTLQSDTSIIACQKMMAQLEVVEMEKSLLSVVKHVDHPHAHRGASIVLCSVTHPLRQGIYDNLVCFFATNNKC